METLAFFSRQWWLLSLVPTLIVLLEIVAIASAFHAVRNVRTSQAAVAWVIGLIMLPFLVLPMYWVFARHRFEGYREAIRAVGDRHEQSVVAIRRELATGTNLCTTTLSTPLEYVADVLDTPLCRGNQFSLLIDGEQYYPTLLQHIAAAKKYVYASFYIIRDDEIGRRFATALVEKAAEGVPVRLLYDEVGCLRLPQAYLDRLTEGGVDVRAFNTRQGFVNRFQINFRNHRKLVVIDGTEAIVGGLNVGDEYLGKSSWAGRWRDTAVRMEGPLARKVQAVFAGDYYWAARVDLPEADWETPLEGDLTSEQAANGWAAVCATGPADRREHATMMFAAAAGTSRKRLWISTPYLVPTDALLISLSMARSRGVDVRLLIPTISDQWAVHFASYYYEHELMELDIPVYRFPDGMMHQKCVLVDDDLVLIGSTNLDNRSLHLNFELMIATDDRDLIRDVARMLHRDFDQAKWSNGVRQPLRPWFERLGTAVARLFSPVL